MERLVLDRLERTDARRFPHVRVSFDVQALDRAEELREMGGSPHGGELHDVPGELTEVYVHEIRVVEVVRSVLAPSRLEGRTRRDQEGHHFELGDGRHARVA